MADTEREKDIAKFKNLNIIKIILDSANRIISSN